MDPRASQVRVRRVPQYDRFIHERFERCLDLYLLPRKLRKKSVVNPRDLLHKMPDMSDLKPFPEQLSAEYIGHAQSVRALDVSACGQWLRAPTTARCVFKVDSGREFFRHSLGAVNRVEAVHLTTACSPVSAQRGVPAPLPAATSCTGRCPTPSRRSRSTSESF